MNSYEQMVSSINKLYYNKTTTLPPDVVIYDNVWNLEWNNPLAIQRVYEVSKLLNRCPDVLGKRVGQSAIWYNPESKVGKGHYHKFEIHDQAYQHTKPARHADFFFVWIRMKMKPEKAANINKITTSAFYYDPGQLVCAACHFIEASIATFSVLKDYNNDRINLEQARQVYDNRISEMLEDFLESEKHEDIGSYPTPLRDILETYIMSDSPPDKIFEGLDKDILVIKVQTVEEEILPPAKAITSLARMGDEIPESFEPSFSDSKMSENELIRNLTMQRLETELEKRGVKPQDLIPTEEDEIEIRKTYKNIANEDSELVAGSIPPNQRYNGMNGITNGMNGITNGTNEMNGIINGRNGMNGIINGRNGMNGITNGIDGTNEMNGIINGRNGMNGIISLPSVTSESTRSLQHNISALGASVSNGTPPFPARSSAPGLKLSTRDHSNRSMKELPGLSRSSTKSNGSLFPMSSSNKSISILPGV